MSISASFNIFCDELKVSSKKESIITLRYNSINKKLNTDFWDINTSYGGIYIGCYGKETANDGITEIEMIFEMPFHLQEKYGRCKGNGQAIFLEDVRSSIAEIYPKTSINKAKHTIKVKFSDGMCFDILPAFIKEGGTYTYADTTNTGSWNTKNPIVEIEAIKVGDATTNFNLKKMCRMAKAWKYNCNVNIKNSLLDTLVYRFITSSYHHYKSYSDFDMMCLDFFKFLMSQKSSKIEWNSIGNSYKITNSINFRYKAIIAHFKAENAIKLTSVGKEWGANQKWREIFGHKFPESTEVVSQLEKMLEKTSMMYTMQKKCAKIINYHVALFVGFQIFIGAMIMLGILIMQYEEIVDIGLTLFIISSLIFITNLYFKKYNLKDISAKHLRSASNIFIIREEFRELLKDITKNDVDVSIIRTKKKSLQRKMIDTYKGTTKYVCKRYIKAIKLLNTISDRKEESIKIDTKKYTIPIWQSTKFYRENQVQCLMNYKNKMI